MSFPKFLYKLRSSKNIERKMMCESLSCLGRIEPIQNYRYIGFGSVEFMDFILFHERYGITELVNIESKEDAKTRVEFNQPYRLIQNKWGKSHKILPLLNWNKRTILWLDYTEYIDADKLSDIALAASELTSGSVLIVTLKAEPEDVEENDRNTKREAKIKDRIQELILPISATVLKRGFGNWRTAEVTREIVNNKILTFLADRNAPLEVEEKIEYHQIFNFHYTDGTRMLTVGGVFLNEEDKEKIGIESFLDFKFVCSGEKSYLIHSPVLTWRETKQLDQMMPIDGRTQYPKHLPKKIVDQYAEVYRYFPYLSEIEA